MFKLIDYKEEDYFDGFQGRVDYWYKVRNVNTGEEKWVSECEYKNMKAKGLLIK